MTGPEPIQPDFTVVLRPPDDLTCGRGVPDNHCQRPAEYHIRWSSGRDTSIVCGAHMDEARVNWVFYGVHSLGRWCSHSGSFWHEHTCLPGAVNLTGPFTGWPM